MLKILIYSITLIPLMFCQPYKTLTVQEKYAELMKSKPMIIVHDLSPPTVQNTHILRFMDNASKITGLPVELIDAVVTVESSGKEKAKSITGPYGYMQITRAVAKKYSLDRNDPYENIIAGSKYLKEMIDKYGSMEYGLAAYNLGPGHVNEFGINEARIYINKVKRNRKEVI